MKRVEKNAMVQKKILIVEDESHIVTVLAIRLSAENFLIDSEPNGLKVMDKAADFNPDLVLLDLVLPGKSGFKLLMEFRESECYADLPIVVCSAKSDPTTIRKVKELGANDYIVKPFDVSDLLNKISMHIIR